VKRPIVLLTAIVAGVAAASAQAPLTPLQRVERDELAFMADEHPDMREAMRRARATLKEFLALAEAPRRGTDTFAVKVAIREGRETEYFWIGDFANKDGRFSGRIDNTPRLVKRVREGETITFAEAEIVDWLYRENGRLKGNYTACALLKQEKKRDAEVIKRRLGLTCDF
jgi:uncharacterized protein YegJ (DUF2314 family)